MNVSRDAFVAGAREASGIPVAVLAAGYLGFGALAADHGIPVGIAVLSTVAIWALPGQLILVEMHTLGATFIALLLSVALSSARFLPMILVLMPLMRHARQRRWRYYLAAQLLSLTGWTMAMARFPSLALEKRLAWFMGFTLVCITGSAIATATGHMLAEGLTPLAKTGLVFMAPMYYLLILVGGVRDRVAAAGLACGALAGPLAYLASPEWSVLGGGVAGGTLAWLVLHAARPSD
jgi:predicted branched-subunit amino acid permease